MSAIYFHACKGKFVVCVAHHLAIFNFENLFLWTLFLAYQLSTQRNSEGQEVEKNQSWRREDRKVEMAVTVLHIKSQ